MIFQWKQNFLYLSLLSSGASPSPTHCMLYSLTYSHFEDTSSIKASPVSRSLWPHIWPTTQFVLFLYGSGTSTCIFKMSFSVCLVFFLLTNTNVLHVRTNFCSCFAFYIPFYFSPAFVWWWVMASACASSTSALAPASAWHCVETAPGCKARNIPVSFSLTSL